jgi:hypothetical protein
MGQLGLMRVSVNEPPGSSFAAPRDRLHEAEGKCIWFCRETGIMCVLERSPCVGRVLEIHGKTEDEDENEEEPAAVVSGVS